MAEQDEKDGGKAVARKTAAAPQSPAQDDARKAALDEHAEAVRRYTEANVKPVPPAADVPALRFTSGPDPDADEVDLSSLGESAEATTVTVPHEVYEEFPAPGAPDRMIKKLLYAKGSQVPKAALQAHVDRQKAANGQ